MTSLLKTGFKLAETDVVVTYVTKGAQAPDQPQVVPLAELYRILRTKHRILTQKVVEWRSATGTSSFTTLTQILQVSQRVKKIAPYIKLDIWRNPAVSKAERIREKSGGGARPKLVLLSLAYADARSAKQTAANRAQLQQELLAVPLLGPSIVLMYNALGKCLLQVLVVVSPSQCLTQSEESIGAYLRVIYPKLAERMRGVDSGVLTDHLIGYDPLAWLQPCPAAGYTLFPSELAEAELDDFMEAYFRKVTC